jgi:hypothetical protein
MTQDARIVLVYHRYQASVACHLSAMQNTATRYLEQCAFKLQPPGDGMLETAAMVLTTRTSEYLQEDGPTGSTFPLELFVTKATD